MVAPQEAGSAQTLIPLEDGWDKPYRDFNLAIFKNAPNFDIAVDPQQLQHLISVSGINRLPKLYQVNLLSNFSLQPHPQRFKREKAVQISPGQKKR